jgi:hypothetical protein
MNWKLILTLACFGILMGILSVNGLTQLLIEPILWTIIAIFSAYRIAKGSVQKTFVHGLVIGLFMGVLNSVVQAIFFEMYLANNPHSTEGFSQMPGGISGQLFIVIASPAIGLAYGVVIGSFSLLAAKLFKGRAT